MGVGSVYPSSARARSSGGISWRSVKSTPERYHVQRVLAWKCRTATIHAVSLGRSAILARWLGPWAKPASVPSGVTRRTVAILPETAGDREFEGLFYLPPGGRPTGAYLVAPGLHYLGPADPRLDRLCRVFAASGLAVFSPFLPDHLALRVTPRTPGDLERAFETMLRQPEIRSGTRPAVFSISFGSLPSLRLAAGPRCRVRIRELVLFGGYADFIETIRYSLTGLIEGEVRGRPDPLNKPVVFINTVHAMPGAPADPAPLLDAWLRFCRDTWGREEMKAGGWTAVAERLAAELTPEMRPLFRVGVGLDEGAREAGEAALARLDTSFCDPSRGGLEGIVCPVHVVHGADDDVIPPNQLAKLAAALPDYAPVSTYLTGLYGHADHAGLPHPFALARELRTMVRMVRMLARAPG